MQPAPVLEQDFLPLRAKILEIAATLDRLDRTEGNVQKEPELKKVRAAIELLLQTNGDRAEQVQLVFSRAYEDGWREKFGIVG